MILARGESMAGTPASAAHGTARLRLAFRAWLPLLAFAMFAGAIAVAGQTAFESYKGRIKESAQGELGGIAELKNRQIVNWMKERSGDAQTLVEDPLFAAQAARWMRAGSPPGPDRDALTQRLGSLTRAYDGYASVALFDRQGMLRLSTLPDEEPPKGGDKEDLLESIRSGKMGFSDIHRESGEGVSRVEIEIRAPLAQAEAGRAHIVGAVLLRIDPSRFLFPLIQHWPTPSSSAETVLVRREGDEVLFLNELRFARNAPLMMRRPLSDTESLAVKAALGREGLAEGVDYRDVPVVGALSRVPGTSWFMVSKVDKAEIYAPIDQLRAWIVGLMVVFVGMGGSAILYWVQKERKQHQHELQHQALATHLDYLAKYSNDIILLLNGRGKIIDFNDRALEVYGYPAEVFSSLSMDDLRAHESTLSIPARLSAIEAAGGGMVFESTHVRSDGERFPVEVSVRRIDIGGEKFYQQIHRDITERKKAEEMLRFHSQILNNLAEGVMLVRASDEVIVFANPQFKRMFGYGRGELVGKRVSILNAPGQRSPEEVAAEINGLLGKNDAWSGDVHNIRKDGTTFWCHVNVSHFEHPQYGKVWVSLHEDITERKDLERQIHVRRREMDELQKLHVAAQTASAIAHELNQPLLAIASYSKAALMMLKADKPDLRQIGDALEGNERQAYRAGQSIRELFDFLNSSEFPLEEFDLVQEIVVLLNDARAEHGMQFQSTLRVEEKLPLVRANRTHVRKVLFNLLHNGVEAAAHGPVLPFITLSVRRTSDGRFAQVTVQDNGPGVSRQDVQHLFEPFFTTKGYGFGMGLTISRSLVEMNGGQLWVAPEEGPGARFHLTIPLAEDRAS